MKIQYFIDDIRRILVLLAPGTRKGLWMQGGLALLLAIVEFTVAGFVSLLGVSLTSPESIANFRATALVVDFFPTLSGIVVSQERLIPLLLVLIALAIACKNALAVLAVYVQNIVSWRAARDVGTRLFSAYMGMPYTWHMAANSSRLQTHVSWRSYISYYVTCFINIIIYGIVTIVLVGCVIAIAPVATLIVFGISSLVAIVIYHVTRHRITETNQRSVSALRSIAKITLEGIQGYREVSIYGRRKAFVDALAHKSTQHAIAASASATLQMLPPLVLEATGFFTLLIAYLAMETMGLELAERIGTLTLLAAASWRILPSINKISGAVAGLQSYRPYILPLLDDIQADASVLTESEPSPLVFDQTIGLSRVCFRYPGANTDALREVSLTIQKGNLIGIVGTSGAGKSTLVGVLTGLLEPKAGCMTVDDLPITASLRNSWAQNIGYVPQACYLLDATLAENVAFKDWGDSIDRERVHLCCRMAAMDFLEQLPQGIDTVIGERGTLLSGGQAQRVSIARALYNNPKVVLFDEATSALDNAAEEAIQKTILGLRETLTLIIIAHRLSTVESCDYIYWLEDGHIKTQGRPDTILPKYLNHLSEIGIKRNSK